VRKRFLKYCKKGEVANGKKEESDDAHKFLHRSGIVCINGFADVVSKTGYEQFKDAIKNTVGSLAEEYDSFTTETGLSVKDNDRILAANYAIEKYDMVNSRREEVSTSEWGGIIDKQLLFLQG